MTKAEQYWVNEIKRLKLIIDSLEERRSDILKELETIDRDLGQELSVLEGLERIHERSKENDGRSV